MALASWDSFDDPLRQVERDAEILLSNLGTLSNEAHTLARRRHAQIAELSSLLSYTERVSLRETVSEFAEKHFMNTENGDGSTVLLLLCKELTKRGFAKALRGDGEEFFGTPPQISPKASERIAYLQNHFTDEAFFKLTARLSKPRAAYFSSFSDVSEEVYHGLCEFCILPVESSVDGKLPRFYALIEKFDLKITAVCDIEAPDGGFTRYALLRHKYVPLHTLHEAHKGCFAEFSMVSDGRVSLTDILRAAELCRMKPVRVDSLSLPYTDGYRYGCVFSLPSFSDETAFEIEAFALYLSIILSEYTPIGVYSKIS